MTILFVKWPTLKLLLILAISMVLPSITLAAKKGSVIFIESLDKKAGCIVVEAEAGAGVDETVLLMTPCTQQAEQIWSISKTQQIITLESDLCLDAGSDDSKTNIPLLSKCDSSKQQQWKVHNKGNIKNAGGSCLGLKLEKAKDSVAQLEITKCTNSKLLRWLITDSKGYAAATKHDEAKGVANLSCPKGQFAYVAKKHPWGVIVSAVHPSINEHGKKWMV